MSEKLLGISRAEQEQRAINGTQWRIIRPDGTPMPADEYASVRALQENRLVEQVEAGVVQPKEEITWISVTATPIPLAEYGVVIVYEDITGRKEMEAALRRSNRDLVLLNRAGQAFNAALEPDQVFDLVLETMRDMWGALDGSIWLVEPFPPPARGKAALVCRYLSPSQSADIRGWRLALDQGVAGWVVQQQQSALVADTRLDPRHDKGVDEHTGQEVRSLLAAPLRSEAGVLGVLELVDHRPDRFDPDDLQTFESLAATAAIAVRNARLYAQVQRDAETKALLLHEVNHRVKNNLDAIIGLLYLERRFAPPETRPYLQPIIAEQSPTPIVALTAHEAAELVDRAGESGVGYYLIKPAQPEELERAMTIAQARFDDMMALRRFNAPPDRPGLLAERLPDPCPAAPNAPQPGFRRFPRGPRRHRRYG